MDLTPEETPMAESKELALELAAWLNGLGEYLGRCSVLCMIQGGFKVRENIKRAASGLPFLRLHSSLNRKRSQLGFASLRASLDQRSLGNGCTEIDSPTVTDIEALSWAASIT